MKKQIVIVLLSLLSWLPASGQGRLVSVLGEQTLTLDQQVDSVIHEFGIDVKARDLDKAVRLLQKFGKSVRYVAITYRSVDPLGNPVTASGLITLPARGPIRGVVEILPYSRQKSFCGTNRLYTTEGLASVLGYITLIPDTIGYGATEALPVAYQLCENGALVSAHLREAAEEYLSKYRNLKMPSRSIIFGYSLGAANALALAYHYAGQSRVKIEALCLGSGAYDPSLVLEHTLQNGRINYLIYPGFAHSLNTWKNAGLHPDKLFTGRVLEDYDLISSGRSNPKDMAGMYGSDVRSYLHPDFFSGQDNEDILRLKASLASLAIPKEAKRPLPSSVKVVIRHSAEDDIVPVACSDRLVQQLRAPGHLVQYIRSKKGTHYETAVLSFIDLALLLL